jgi:putative endonuclease
MDFSVYIIYSESLNKFYIGYTSDFNNRLDFHNCPNNTIWTKKGQPWAVHLIIDQLDKSQALRMEKHLKKMKSRKYLAELNTNPQQIDDLKKRFA